MQQFNSLCRQLNREKIDAREITPGPGEARDQTELDGVGTDIEHDGDRRGCRLGLQRRMRTPSSDHSNASPNQFGGERRQPLGLVLGPAVFDRHVLAFYEARVLDALAKCAERLGERLRRLSIEESDHRHRLLLRACRERPCCGRATDQRDELAAVHSITSSASASTCGGMSRRNALATTRLMISSNLVVWATGRSAGSSPLRMRPV